MVLYNPSTGDVVLVVECKLNPAQCLIADSKKLRSSLDKLVGRSLCHDGQQLRFEDCIETLYVGRDAFNVDAFVQTAKWKYFGKCIKAHRFAELTYVPRDSPHFVLPVPGVAVREIVTMLPSQTIVSIVGAVSSIDLESYGSPS